MAKLMVVFFLVVMACAAISQEDGDEFTVGGLKQWATYLCEGIENETPCDRGRPCCSDLKCFIDGKCGKLISYYAKDGSEIEVAPIVGKWVYYDGCDSDLSRLEEKCTKDSDCCPPFQCSNRKCSATANTLEFLAFLRGF